MNATPWMCFRASVQLRMLGCTTKQEQVIQKQRSTRFIRGTSVVQLGM